MATLRTTSARVEGSKSTTKTRVARVPYLNSAPFFRGFAPQDAYTLEDYVPRRLGEQAAAGTLDAGPLPLADFFRLERSFERLGRFGIAVRGRAHSALLFARRPIRQLDGAVIGVTEETSTTALLLRLLLEQRYHLKPAAYERGLQDAEARLVIGDEALRFRQANTRYPYEIDLGFEWWLWQHLPFVFAVWAVRKDLPDDAKKRLEHALAHALAVNTAQLEPIVQAAAQELGLSAAEIQAYLSSFIYRLSQPEEEGIARFRELVDVHHLL